MERTREKSHIFILEEIPKLNLTGIFLISVCVCLRCIFVNEKGVLINIFRLEGGGGNIVGDVLLN